MTVDRKQARSRVMGSPGSTNAEANQVKRIDLISRRAFGGLAAGPFRVIDDLRLRWRLGAARKPDDLLVRLAPAAACCSGGAQNLAIGHREGCAVALCARCTGGPACAHRTGRTGRPSRAGRSGRSGRSGRTGHTSGTCSARRTRRSRCTRRTGCAGRTCGADIALCTGRARLSGRASRTLWPLAASQKQRQQGGRQNRRAHRLPLGLMSLFNERGNIVPRSSCEASRLRPRFTMSQG
jgi:hypothetical protein